MLFDVIEAKDPIHCGDIQGAIPIRDADWLLQATGNGVDLIGALIAVCVHHSIDIALGTAADKQCAVLSQCHSTRIGDIVRVDRDRETGGKLDLIQRKRARMDLAC